MAAVGIVLSVAQTLFAALESPVLKDVCSILGYRSELQNLKNTVSTVRAVLLDAESKHDHELSNEARDWIEKLKDAVYDADDLLDEFTTLAEQKQLLEGEGAKISKEVRAFFSCFNQLGVAYTMSRGIKKIRKELDAIACDHIQFGIGVVKNEPIWRRKKETCSYVYEHNIIGREDDKKVVIDMLLDPNVEGNVSFVTIVGIGGLGKTTLAQLVYNDSTIKKEFPLRLWACVSDQDPKHFDMKAVLCKILESATRSKHEGLELDGVQDRLRKELDGKKYLLVLDDVWNEDRDECLRLCEFLMGSGKGSRVVVTTRSKKTVSVIGNGRTHELQGLSGEDSWSLFERMAFDQRQGELDPEFVEIGREIVKKCANVPLAIRMLGTLLYSESKTKWLAIQRNGLAKMGQGEDDIMHILKLSYHHLDTHLKSCFSYCAIFPKDYIMKKQTMISLWMAQGYLEPLYDGQSLDDVGEEYFSILLRRCFFQNVIIVESGEILSCKMHDLMHDIAQEVAGKEICMVMRKMDEKARHAYNFGEEFTGSSFTKFKIRSYVGISLNQPPVGAILSSWMYLRALDLNDLGIKHIPSTIGRLLHLRYLNLSHNYALERLPEEITKLHNMQTLELGFCKNLKELPRGLSKLIKLRVLDISGCSSLTSMPLGMGKLTGLCKLPLFIVAEANSSQKLRVGQLKDIESLNGLKGHLRIKMIRNATYCKGNGKQGILKGKEHLKDIHLSWEGEKNDERTDGSDEALLEDLQPPPYVRKLALVGYHDVNTPSWARENNLTTVVPNLVSIGLESCKGLQYLPMLGKLPFLKALNVINLSNLVYMENNCTTSSETSSSTSVLRSTQLPFFPSLERLCLSNLPKLQGWWRSSPGDDDRIVDGRLPSFPRLSELMIVRCDNFTRVPLCGNVERLLLYGINERLRIMTNENTDGDSEKETVEATHSSYAYAYPSSSVKTLRWISTDNAGYLKSVPMEAFQSLSEIHISNDHKLESLSEIKEVLQSCSSSLRTLKIEGCSHLRTLSRGALEHLIALESLELDGNNNMQMLPECIGCLSSLQVLTLSKCQCLKSLPDGIRALTSLRELCIWACSPDLGQRCQNPDGADWPKIQHIPHIFINLSK